MTRQTEGKQPVAFAAMKQYTGKRNRSMKNFYIATMGADFCRYAKAHDTGIELDQFCMAENLEGVKYENVKQEIMQIMEDSGIGGSDMVLHAPFSELHPAAIDPEALKLARRRMDQAYRACEDLGIKKMVASLRISAPCIFQIMAYGTVRGVLDGFHGRQAGGFRHMHRECPGR